MGGASRPAMVRRAARIPAGALGRRSDETIAAVRLFSVRWRAAPVHRECVCADGSGADSGDDRAEVSIAAGGESSGSAAGLHHAEAATWSARHAGVAAAKRNGELVRGTIGGRGLIPFPKNKSQQKKKRESDGSQLPAGGNRTEFGTRLHDPENGVARDHSNDLGRIVAGAAYHGHLIDVRAQEPLEQTQGRLVRRCP